MVRLDDLDAPETVPAFAALRNLADLHCLPDYVKGYASVSGVSLALTHDTAEAWRAALGAPLFTEHPRDYCTQFKTSVLWFGIQVRLSYTDY